MQNIANKRVSLQAPRKILRIKGLRVKYSKQRTWQLSYKESPGLQVRGFFSSLMIAGLEGVNRQLFSAFNLLIP
jgi:hypothetical protein